MQGSVWTEKRMESGRACPRETARDDEARRSRIDVVRTGARRAHEAKCLKCGRCCHAKLVVGDRVVYTDVPCAYLDVETKLCTVYERRHEVNPDCLDVEAGTKRGVFPTDCPYVRDVPGYKPPVTGLGPEEILELIGALEAEEVET